MKSCRAWVVFVVVVIGLCCIDGLTYPRRTEKKKAKWGFDSNVFIDPNNRTYCPETPDNRPSNRVNTTERIAALRSAMLDTVLTGGQTLDAYLIFVGDDHLSEYPAAWDGRLGYISGFSGSAGYAIVTADQSATWTDGRYFLQADMQMDCNWILMKQGQPGYPTGEEWLVSVLPQGARVGAYPNYVSISTWQSYEAALLGKATLVGVPQDLVDVIWTAADPGRPPRPNTPPFVHDVFYAGVEWRDKIAQVRQKLVDQQADALIVTILEEIAWLFNLRGSDQSNSVFFAFSIVLQNEIRLFLSNHQTMIAAIEVQNHLDVYPNGTCRTPGSGCTNVFEYNAIIDHITGLANQNLSVWLDPTANYATYSAAGTRKQVLRSPIALMKAVKNDVEKVKFADCIMRDSAALIEFLAFMELEIAAGRNWTEVSAATKLEEIRSTYPDFKGISFDTISAYGPHASIIHYSPDPSSPDTNSQITTDGVYLLDSGGQYLDGTTDVTRTMHYGTPEPVVKEAYTLVLISSIELAQTVWPDGLYGADFDSRARTPLWQNGWDYNHGTGHGIGYFLAVHEGPGRINLGAYSPEWTEIHEGMFFSDEPGYYEDNVYGIRLETLVQVVEANVPNHFNNKKYLGFASVTLVPFEPNLIDYSLLSPGHIEFLNYYNQLCLDKVGPYLQDIRNNQQAYDWLLARVQTIVPNARVEPRADSSLSTLVTPSIWMTIALTVMAAIM